MKTFAVSLLLFSTFILFGLGFDTNYQQDLDLTITAIKTAKSIEDLNNSPFHPRKTFQNIARKPIDSHKLCVVFDTLPVTDLALLENYLEEYKVKFNLSCQDTLSQKIAKFHSRQNLMLVRMVEKDREFSKKNDGSYAINWSPLEQIKPVGEKQPYFFKGTSPVTKSSVIYQKDLTTTSPNINKLQLQKGEIILTFDDGPHPTRTQQILQTLNQHQVYAVFFALGEKAKLYPNVVKEVLKGDNVYGSHSYSHKELPKLAIGDAKEEIRQGHLNVVKAANGEDSGFFRFPYGSRNTALAQYLKDNSLSSFFWSMDSLDWKYSEPLKLYNHIVSEINREQKGILLFHDVHQQTVTVLNSVLENLYNAGYSIRIAVPIEWTENENDKAI